MNGLGDATANGVGDDPGRPHYVAVPRPSARRPGRVTHLETQYEAAFFGRFQIKLDDWPLADQKWRRNGVRTLLKWFLLNPGERFTADQLCSLLWPDRDNIRTTNNFHVTLHYLRRGLEPDLPRGAASTFVRSDRKQHYWFDFSDRWWTDVLEVDALSRAGQEAERRGEARLAIECYERVLAHYELNFLPEDIYDDIFEPYRREHDLAHGDALNHLMRLHMQENQLPNAHAAALRALAMDPYAEVAVKTLVRVHLSHGNTAAAVRQLDELFHLLARDLGCLPSGELRRLRQSIQSGDVRALPPRRALGMARRQPTIGESANYVN